MVTILKDANMELALDTDNHYSHPIDETKTASQSTSSKPSPNTTNPQQLASAEPATKLTEQNLHQLHEMYI